MSAKEVSSSGNMDKVRVSRAVVDLERRGLVERRVSPLDARISELRLTRDGDRLFARIAPLALDWEGRLLANLDGSQRQLLMQLLDNLEYTLGLDTAPELARLEDL